MKSSSQKNKGEHMSEIAEFLRALNGALGLIAIAFCVYFLACILTGKGDDK
jgi:hypothetical protein